jgi:hypothetical protein
VKFKERNELSARTGSGVGSIHGPCCTHELADAVAKIKIAIGDDCVPGTAGQERCINPNTIARIELGVSHTKDSWIVPKARFRLAQ